MANSDLHIASAFDRDLEALQAHLVRLSGLVETALVDAVAALEAQDIPAAEKVIAGDPAIDALEEFIQTEAASLIARRAPTASDLRLVLAVMRVAHSLERVGDYAKNVAKRTRVLGPSAPVEGHAGTIRRMTMLHDPWQVEQLDPQMTCIQVNTVLTAAGLDLPTVTFALDFTREIASVGWNPAAVA